MIHNTNMHKKGARRAQTALILKRLMGETGQNELARDMTEAGYPMNQPTISRILDGTEPEFDTAEKFARYYNISVNQFLGREFWAPASPELKYSPKAIRVAQMYDDLPKAMQEHIFAIVQALSLRNQKPKEPVDSPH